MMNEFLTELRNLILTLPSYEIEEKQFQRHGYGCYHEYEMREQHESCPGDYLKRSDIEALFKRALEELPRPQEHPTLPGTVKGTHHGWE